MKRRKFIALLRGREEVPSIRTFSFGRFQAKVTKNKQKLLYKIILDNISKVTAVNLYLGRRGKVGPMVAKLFGPINSSISVLRGVIEGAITSENLTGPLKGKNIKRLIKKIEKGKIYVNVKTKTNPTGKLRGQLIQIIKY